MLPFYYLSIVEVKNLHVRRSFYIPLLIYNFILKTMRISTGVYFNWNRFQFLYMISVLVLNFFMLIYALNVMKFFNV